ncbi:MAG TPA: UDP-N-acetyl-D-mannosamine dehydrogenase [Candidatus Rifleibacterium sp.]|nr:UDP-N-acetyl-D-mannosamine dehydrogenase [Candidatus Rifleibacterium sp.]HPT47493.1 UDP-N-acetyl-D-mannosamine dehydrogenase [Candidatus Rifleibacterium sp.]
MLKKKRICVMGLGYIGLPTSALLANKGYEVHGVDVKTEVVATINQGRIHIVEPDLETFVKAAVNSGNLKADLKPAHADVFFISVPTPFNDGYVPNIDYVLAATRAIAPLIQENNIVILESTSPVGTTEKIQDLLKETRPELFKSETPSFFLAHCPERVLPGQIMKELVENDRIVGGTTPDATRIAAAFYREFVQGEVYETDARTAEMCKLTENSYRDVNIAFANELSMLCDKFDIDVWKLINLANRHPRVKILKPGCGVGGHCIAVDPWFIVHAGGETAKLIRVAREVNNYKTEWVIEKIKNTALKFENENGRKPVIACMGLAFKPDIDDLRESPALNIFRRLRSDGLSVLAVEPNLEKHKDFELTHFQIALQTADLLAFLVAHKEFKNLQIDSDLNFCGVFNSERP